MHQAAPSLPCTNFA